MERRPRLQPSTARPLLVEDFRILPSALIYTWHESTNYELKNLVDSVSRHRCRLSSACAASAELYSLVSDGRVCRTDAGTKNFRRADSAFDVGNRYSRYLGSAFGRLCRLMETNLLSQLRSIRYGCQTHIGDRYTKRLRGFYAVPSAALIASAVFFLTTNFASWLAFYDLSWSGLAACYMNAIPYFQNTCLSALCYSGILFGILAGYDRLRPAITEKVSQGSFAD